MTSFPSEHGKMRLPAKKCDILSFIDEDASTDPPPPSFHAKIFDGPVIVHILSTEAKTFDQYGTDIFLPWTQRVLQNSARIDIVWDTYKADSLKEFTREKRGHWVRRKVSGHAKFPSKFQDFLRDSSSKQELFEFLTQKVLESDYPQTSQFTSPQVIFNIILLLYFKVCCCFIFYRFICSL